MKQISPMKQIFIYHGWIFHGFSSQIVCDERTCNEKLECSKVLQHERGNCGLCVLYLINFFTGSSPLWKIFAQHDVYISSEARLGYLLSLFTAASFWSTFVQQRFWIRYIRFNECQMRLSFVEKKD